MQAHLGLSVVSHTVEPCRRFARLVISGAIPYRRALLMRIHAPDDVQGSGHGARLAGSLDRLTWLFAAMGRLFLALGAPKLM